MKAMLSNRWFLLGLVIKIGALFFFGSRYLLEYFIPFIDAAIVNFGQNPWDLKPTVYFPYGSILFLVHFTPKWFFHLFLGDLALGTGPFALALMKAPLLVFDAITASLLVRAHPTHRNQVILFYWLNPAAFYITYVHGQLDVVSMAFCILSLHLLFSRRHVWSGIAMGASTLCKFHVVAAIPFLLVYLWKQHFRQDAIKTQARWIAAWGLVTALGFLPHAFSKSLEYVSVGSPEAMRLFGATLAYGQQAVFIGVALVLAVLARLCLSNWISNNGLAIGFGAIFASLLLATNPMPGWTYWIIPFYAFFFAQYAAAPKALYWCHQAAFFAHFVLVGSLLPAESVPALSNLSLTLFQFSVATLLFAMFVYALAFEAPLKRLIRPLMVGIAGDSGSGKSRLTKSLQALFGAATTAVIEVDNYHRWERNHRGWNEFTHLDPRANDLPKLAEHTRQMSRGMGVTQAQYDHGTGRFSLPQVVRPKRTVIVEGLHSLYFRRMQNSFDLRVFLATAPALRKVWKLRRDTSERGHTLPKALKIQDRRTRDAEIHIKPQQQHADWTIEYFPLKEISPKTAKGVEPIQVGVRHFLWNDSSLSLLVEALGQLPDTQVKMQVDPDDASRTVLEFIGEIRQSDVTRMGETLFPSLRRILRNSHRPTWKEDLDGLNQLIALALLSELEEDTKETYADLYPTSHKSDLQSEPSQQAAGRRD